MGNLSHELKLLVDHPNGTKDNPATTCKELLLAQPHLPDGTGIISSPRGRREKLGPNIEVVRKMGSIWLSGNLAYAAKLYYSLVCSL